VKNPASAFTLIELSLVLVIVGLIVSGLLVGRELIIGAEIRSQISAIEMIKTSTNTFKNKYNALPGDISSTHATNFGFPAPAGGGISNGNEDGWVNGSWPNTLEVKYFFHHLKAVGYLSCICAAYDAWVPNFSVPNNYYPAAVKGGFVAVYGGTPPGGAATWGVSPAARVDLNENYIEIGPGQPSGGTNTYDPVMKPIEAYAIDHKMDDGLPLSGAVTAVGKGSPWTSEDWWLPHPATQGAAGSASCIDSGSSVYNTRYDRPICSLRIKGGF
jgi:prepilin-type N-terminal cleavage/methylation domain-containing protein